MKIINHPQRLALVFIALLLPLTFAATAYAHGVVITYTLKANGEVELFADFDTGEPMAEAQVTIYSPEDPLTPWLTGTADARGRYVFIIDPEMPGIWDIQYRKAGHGDIVHLQLEEGMIDPAMLDQGPGELLPDAPAAGTAPEAGSGVTAVEEESNEAEGTVLAARETEVEAAKLTTAEPATAAESKQTKAEEMETGAVTVPETETAVQPESLTQSEIVPDIDMAEQETAAQVAPEPATAPKETGEATVLSSGGNVSPAGGFTSLQILLMSASVIWGFVGTALYFSSKKTQDHEHGHGHHH